MSHDGTALVLVVLVGLAVVFAAVAFIALIAAVTRKASTQQRPVPAAGSPPPQAPESQYRAETFDVNDEGESFAFAIVGESHYQAALRAIGSDETIADFIIVPEPSNQSDPNAIAVFGYPSLRKVGYFSRDEAAEWSAIAHEMGKKQRVGMCKGVLRGGDTERRSIGVWLNLADPHEVLGSLRKL